MLIKVSYVFLLGVLCVMSQPPDSDTDLSEVDTQASLGEDLAPIDAETVSTEDDLTSTEAETVSIENDLASTEAETISTENDLASTETETDADRDLKDFGNNLNNLQLNDFIEDISQLKIVGLVPNNKRDFLDSVAKWAKIIGDVATAANGRDIRNMEVLLSINKRDIWESLAKWAPIVAQAATAAVRDIQNMEVPLDIYKKDSRKAPASPPAVQTAAPPVVPPAAPPAVPPAAPQAAPSASRFGRNLGARMPINKRDFWQDLGKWATVAGQVANVVG